LRICASHARSSPLDGSTILPTEAKCNAAGSCCLTFCYGYSKADIFPTVDQPLCGVCVNPTTMSWDQGDLEQKWTFTSQRGQISLQSLQSAEIESVSSYKSSPPLPTIDLLPEITVEDKDLLDSEFHAAGGAIPSVPWFAFRLQGPGMPEDLEGQFIWLASPRYLIIPGWITSLMASQLVAPLKSQVSLRLDPGFCPAVAPSSRVATTRLITDRQLLLDTLQSWPPDSMRILPPSSILLYRPTKGLTKVFTLDTKTNQMAVMPLDPRMFPALINIYVIGALIPLVLALLITGLLVYLLFGLLKSTQSEMIRHSSDSAAIYSEFHAMRAFHPSERGERVKTLVKDRELRHTEQPSEADSAFAKAHSSFYHMVNELLNPGFAAQNYTHRLFLACTLLAAGSLPSWYVLKAASEIKESTLQSICESSIDKCSCYAQSVSYATLLNAVGYCQMIVAMLELSSYFLCMPYMGLVWKNLRRLFYFLFFFSGAISIYLLVLNGLWVLVAALMDPVKVVPYAVSLIGFAYYSIN
jgi:hypothetical protein